MYARKRCQKNTHRILEKVEIGSRKGEETCKGNVSEVAPSKIIIITGQKICKNATQSSQ